MTVYQSVSHPYEKVTYRKSFTTENETTQFIAEKWGLHKANQRADLNFIGFFQGRTVILTRAAQNADCKVLETALGMICPVFSDPPPSVALTLVGNEQSEAAPIALALRKLGVPVDQVHFRNKARL